MKKKVDIIKSDPEIMNMLHTYEDGIKNHGGSSGSTSSSRSNIVGDDIKSDNNKYSSSNDGSGDSDSQSDKVTIIGHITYISENLCNNQSIIDILINYCNFNSYASTLIISECCLVYIEKEYVLELCSNLNQILYHHTLWFSYDMINPNDIYGKQMLKNLTLAGFKIPGFQDFPTLSDQSQRFLRNLNDTQNINNNNHNSSRSSDGNNNREIIIDRAYNDDKNQWHDAMSFTMRTYYEKMINNEEKKRLKTLELFDEIEEFNLLMDHYSYTIATKGSKFKSILNL